MNLKKKKALAAKTFGLGKSKIVFLTSRIDEIKEAITKQDIRDLYNEGAILIKDDAGRRTARVRIGRRSTGNIRKKIVGRKRKYVIMTRKLRRHLKEHGRTGKISKEHVDKIRNKIKNKEFKNKFNLNEYLKTNLLEKGFQNKN